MAMEIESAGMRKISNSRHDERTLLLIVSRVRDRIFSRASRRCVKFRAGSSYINVAEKFSVVPRVLLVSPLPLRQTEMPKLSSSWINGVAVYEISALFAAAEKQKNMFEVTFSIKKKKRKKKKFMKA